MISKTMNHHVQLVTHMQQLDGMIKTNSVKIRCTSDLEVTVLCKITNIYYICIEV